ncbi:MAG: hypothetical protein DME26_06070 [Verrucomicrobia bacterium]|nr:MAG: hypothetical protein DME26_06070 [Verrucomicrobiota bacterium]
MRLAAIYSFNNGEKIVSERYPNLVDEVRAAIAAVDEKRCKTKESFESTTTGKFFYSPVALNKAFKKQLIEKRGWKPGSAFEARCCDQKACRKNEAPPRTAAASRLKSGTRRRPLVKITEPQPPGKTVEGTAEHCFR